MERVTYQKGAEFLRRVVEEYPSGELKVICPACDADMIVVLSKEEAFNHSLGPGLFCPNGHIQVVLNLR